MGCGFSLVPRPSIVVTSCPSSAAFTCLMHDRIGAPSSNTVQAPHCARPQPNFGPFSWTSLINTDSRVVGVAESTSIENGCPFTMKLTVTIGMQLPSALKQEAGSAPEQKGQGRTTGLILLCRPHERRTA